jgi:hypothetical protein
MYILILREYCLEIIDEKSNIEQEMEILDFSEKLDDKQIEELREERKKPVNRKALENSIIKIPLQTKFDEKKLIYDEVFKYKNGPTMTLEEFSEIEMKDLYNF